MKALIAAEYHVLVPDDMPIHEIQYMAALAENRRSDRQKAAQEGKIWVG